MTAPLQVRPANQGKEEERKLFVGMIPKTFTDPELKALISRYGVVEEATILRDKDGLSKGRGTSCGIWCTIGPFQKPWYSYILYDNLLTKYTRKVVYCTSGFLLCEVFECQCDHIPNHLNICFNFSNQWLEIVYLFDTRILFMYTC